jgi:hypothetical protein
MEVNFLSGKVLKRSLPLIPGRPGADAPRLKRLGLAQGELAQMHDGEPGIHYLAYLELHRDKVRGNHFHELKHEFLYLIEGQVLAVFEDVVTRERISVEVNGGDLVSISVKVAHVFKPLAEGQGIEFSPAAFDNSDIVPYTLI